MSYLLSSTVAWSGVSQAWARAARAESRLLGLNASNLNSAQQSTFAIAPPQQGCLTVSVWFARSVGLFQYFYQG